MQLDLHLDNVKRISPAWWSAVAGAAVAGAALFSGHRIAAGLALGGAMFFVALKMTPCCDGCAQGAGCGGAAPQPTPATPVDARNTTSSSGGLDAGANLLVAAMTDAAVVASNGKLKVCA